MVVTTKAIVFSALKYSEADLIVTCFTQTSGIKTYLLRGVLKSRKGKMRASYFQPLTQLEIVANHKDKGTLEYMKEVKVAYPYQTIHTHIEKSAIAMFLSEILKNTIREEEVNDALFIFLESALQWLDLHVGAANFHIYFLLKLSKYLGFYPDDSDIDLPFFNLQEGVFQKNITHIYCEEGEVVEAFKKFFGLTFEESAEIRIAKKLRAEVLDLVLAYYQLHLQEYKKPKSLAVLHQIFQ